MDSPCHLCGVFPSIANIPSIIVIKLQQQACKPSSLIITIQSNAMLQNSNVLCFSIVFPSNRTSMAIQIKLTMASIIKRKEQVNQLRRAHFPFGFEDNKAVVSQYKKQYTEQPVSLVQPNGDRNSHFTIGSDQPAMAKNTYQSEFKEKYPEHPFVKQASLRKSNDENNIVLGFGGAQPVTNYKDQFTQKQQERNKPVDQRIISVDLGDSLTDFTTTYHKAYDGSQGERPERVNNSLANTNLVLGYDQGHFVTSNAAIHNAKPIHAASTKGRHYGTNISLGTDGGQFHSQAKQQFSHKDSTKQTVDKERVLDFKSAHFKFGFPEQITQNLTETQAHYNEKPLTAIKIEGKKPVNVQLRHDSNNYFQSSYGDHFTEKKAERAEPINKDSRNSNVIIGMGGETYNSEAKDQFSAKQAERIKGKGAEGSLVLGDGTRDFTTHYQQTHGNKFNELQLNRVSKEEIAKLRVENYVNGFINPDYRLHSHNYGAISGGQGGKLPREVIDKMRGTNIVNSDSNNFYGSTTHKASYGWKKNEDF